jgi:hypothetical protein
MEGERHGMCESALNVTSHAGHYSTGTVACHNISLYSMLYLDIALSHHVYFQQLGDCSHSQGILSDEGSSGLQNNQRPRTEPRIVLQRIEYKFPGLKDSWVSVLCLCLQKGKL